MICSSRYMMRPCTLKTYAAYRLKMSSNARNVIPKLGDAEHLARAHMGDAHAGTPRGRLKFGIWNDEFGNPARSIHLQLELSTRTAASRPSPIIHSPSDIAALRLACFASGRCSTKSPSFIRNSSTALSLCPRSGFFITGDRAMRLVIGEDVEDVRLARHLGIPLSMTRTNAEAK